jgi:hypothetical protein
MMRWRVLLGALLGFILPVPLALLLGSVRQEWTMPRPPAPPGVRVSPMLSREERAHLTSYRRECLRNSDCESPLGCYTDLRRRNNWCIDSECLTDRQCPDGLVCQSLATANKGLLVRRCVPLGPRQEGEKCLPLSSDRESACGPGLVCGGEQGFCGRPCQKDDAASCPEGFFCGDVEPEPICLPSCEKRGCPEGQRCLHFKEGASSCDVVYGPDCQSTPCPEGQKCDVMPDPRFPGKVWTECIQSCGRDRPPCPEGLVCDRYHCITPCDPSGPNPCAQGYHCDRRAVNLPWSCQPDYWSGP